MSGVMKTKMCWFVPFMAVIAMVVTIEVGATPGGNPQKATQAKQKELRAQEAKLAKEIAVIDKKLAANSKKQDNLLSAIEAGLDQGLVNKRAKKVKAEADELNAQRDALMKKMHAVKKELQAPEYLTITERIAQLEKMLGKAHAGVEEKSGDSDEGALSSLRFPGGGRLSFSGFIDMSISRQEGSGFTEMTVDQVELDVEYAVGEKFLLRADFDYTEFDTAGDVDVEQAYFDYCPFDDTPFTFSFGKFNAPIGIELLDPPDMYQYSHSLVFDNGIPTNMIGAKFAYQFNDKFDAVVYIANGWDANAETNDGKTYGFRFGFTPVEDFNFGVSGIFGNEVANNSADGRWVLDLDLTYEGLPNTLIGAEFNIGGEEDAWAKAGGVVDDAEWVGFSVMGNYTFTDLVNATLRFSLFDDTDGASRTGTLYSFKGPRLWEVTAAINFPLQDYLLVLVEYRYDSANEKGVYGARDKNNHTTALEMIVSF